VEDPAYTYRKLAPVLDGVEWPRFLSTFRGIARLDLVHEFAGDEAG
jgi:hypothetical protein